MKRVLLVGFDPATVDFSDPALPPGMTAEKIHAGVKLALADFAGRGWHAQNCFIRPDETAIPTIEHFLAGDIYDCVVIVAVFLALAVTSLLAARLSGTSVRRALARNFALGAATMGLTLLGGWLLPM